MLLHAVTNSSRACYHCGKNTFFIITHTDIYISHILAMYKAHKRAVNANSPYGAVAKSSASGLVGTGFASQYRLQPRVGF